MGCNMNFITWLTYHLYTHWITMPVCHPVCLHICHPQGKFRICEQFVKLWYFLFPLFNHFLSFGRGFSSAGVTPFTNTTSLEAAPSAQPLMQPHALSQPVMLSLGASLLLLSFPCSSGVRVLSSIREAVHRIIVPGAASWLHPESKSWQWPQDGRDTVPVAAGLSLPFTSPWLTDIDPHWPLTAKHTKQAKSPSTQGLCMLLLVWNVLPPRALWLIPSPGSHVCTSVSHQRSTLIT